MLLGFTSGGGPFRTAPFSSDAGRAARAEFDRFRAYAKSLDNAPANDDSNEWVPPVSMAALVGFTHSQAPLSAPTDPYQPNDNLALSTVNLYWGGAITDNIGAFVQVTRSAPPPGGNGGDPFAHAWGWDMTDIRYANSANIGGVDLIYGITLNNSPTAQDPWNTTPVHRFPYEAKSNIAPDPGVSTLLEATFMDAVIGTGAYALINDMLYLEATAYTSIQPRAQDFLGVDPLMSPGLINGVAPYWRVALDPNWGHHSLMVGTFGMFARVNPWAGGMGMGLGAANPLATFQQTNDYTDIGVDSQYQYQGDNYWLTLRGAYINESQRNNAGFANGNAANPTNTLNSLQVLGSIAYGRDNRVVLTGEYFNIWGSSDAMLYANLASGVSPNSDGWKAEIAYIPFGASLAPGYPWGNVRVGLQYTWYNKFQGTTIGARDNNTLFLYARFFM